MAIINVNPNAEVSSFASVKAGVYRMRIKSVEVRNAKTDGTPINGLKFVFEHTASAFSLFGIDGNPLKGIPSVISAYPSLEPDKQSMLRSIVEATGTKWESFVQNPDTDSLIGLELDIQVKTEEYQGETNNKFGRALSSN